MWFSRGWRIPQSLAPAGHRIAISYASDEADLPHLSHRRSHANILEHGMIKYIIARCIYIRRQT